MWRLVELNSLSAIVYVARSLASRSAESIKKETNKYLHQKPRWKWTSNTFRRSSTIWTSRRKRQAYLRICSRVHVSFCFAVVVVVSVLLNSNCVTYYLCLFNWMYRTTSSWPAHIYASEQWVRNDHHRQPGLFHMGHSICGHHHTWLHRQHYHDYRPKARACNVNTHSLAYRSFGKTSQIEIIKFHENYFALEIFK